MNHESDYERYNREAREKPHAPEFSSIEEEAEFWQTHDSEDYYSEPVEEEMQFVPARRTKAMAAWSQRHLPPWRNGHAPWGLGRPP